MSNIYIEARRRVPVLRQNSSDRGPDPMSERRLNITKLSNSVEQGFERVSGQAQTLVEAEKEPPMTEAGSSRGPHV